MKCLAEQRSGRHLCLVLMQLDVYVVPYSQSDSFISIRIHSHFFFFRVQIGHSDGSTLREIKIISLVWCKANSEMPFLSHPRRQGPISQYRVKL